MGTPQAEGGLGGSTPRHQLPALIAKREGTRGFRAPEVLMQCSEQGPPLDVWSGGVILLCLLSRRYPTFDAPHDLHALAEIVLLVGPAAAAAAAADQQRNLSLVRPFAFAPSRYRSAYSVPKVSCMSAAKTRREPRSGCV